MTTDTVYTAYAADEWSIVTWTATPAQRRAYAIRKAKEREAAARRERQELRQLPETTRIAPHGYSVHPDNHACDVGDIDMIDDRNHRCRECGRRWTYSEREVLVTPVTKIKPSSVTSSRTAHSTQDLPPPEVVGAARGAWWKAYAEARRAKLNAA